MLRPESLLVVTATPGEAQPLLDALADARAHAPGGASAAGGRLHGVHVHVRVLGVGKTNTAAGLARVLTQAPPAAVVQLGIGGTYAGSFLPVGSAAVAEVEVDLDFGVRTERGWGGADALGFGLVGATPLRASADRAGPGREGAPDEGVGVELGNRVPTDATLTRWLAGGADVPVVAFGTSDAVSGDLATAEARRAQCDVSVESMEGAAAAQTALAFGVPFAEVRGVSNVAGQRDKAHWEVRAALRAATGVLLAALRASR